MLHHVHLDGATVAESEILLAGVGLIEFLLPFALEIECVGKYHTGCFIEVPLGNDLFDKSFGVLVSPRVDGIHDGGVLQVGGLNSSLEILFPRLPERLFKRECIVHPNGIGDVHVGVFVQVGQVLEEVLVVGVEVIHTIVAGTYRTEYLIKGLTLSAISHHRTDNGNTQRREKHVLTLRLCGTNLLEQVKGKAILVGVYHFLLRRQFKSSDLVGSFTAARKQKSRYKCTNNTSHSHIHTVLIANSDYSEFRCKGTAFF